MFWEFRNTIRDYMVQVFSGLFAVRNPANANAVIPMKEAINQTQINEKAERLLNEYGNHILRLAYSYLHNLSDADSALAGRDDVAVFVGLPPARLLPKKPVKG